MSTETLSIKDIEAVPEKLEWKNYPGLVNLDELFSTQIDDIEKTPEEDIRSEKRDAIIEQIYQDYFAKKLESGQGVLFNVLVPKKGCIPQMLRRLIERCLQTMQIAAPDKENELKVAVGEVFDNLIEHQKEEKNFPLVILVDPLNKTIQCLIGDPVLPQNLNLEEIRMPAIDPVEFLTNPAILEERGRGLPIIKEYSDGLEVRCDDKKQNLAYLITKKF